MGTIGQTSVTVFPATAQAGQLADLALNVIETFTAIEVINPGRFVEVASDGLSVQQVQGSSSSDTTGHFYKTCLGVSIMKTAREGAGASGVTAYGVGGPAYAIGDPVPVLRRGRIFAEWKGTTQPAFGQAQVYHSSTTADLADRGKVTDAAVGQSAGSEVSYLPAGVLTRYKLPGTGPVVLIDVNFPSATTSAT